MKDLNKLNVERGLQLIGELQYILKACDIKEQDIDKIFKELYIQYQNK